MKKNRNSKRFVRNLSLMVILICMSTASLFAQVKISGTVVDSKKEPLIGVNVKVADSKTGTITDIDGKYTITVPNRNAVLSFSYIGSPFR